MHDYSSQLHQVREYFNSGATQSYAFRKEKLEALRRSMLRHEKAIAAALFEDLHKSEEEAWVTETGFVLAEIRHTLKHLRRWMKPQRVPTNLLNLPSRSYLYKEPLGVVLIIGPWNYPLQLLLSPLVGAIAAGNCAVLKPSEVAPATAAVMRGIIADAFDPTHVLYAEGDGAQVVPQLMDRFRFDHLLYTGSTAVGKSIYQLAAKSLTPVTLELGGKSPCVVERDANIKVAARRIASTKFSNAGQMCVAPDYVLVHHSRKDELVNELKAAIHSFFGDDAVKSEGYGRIINAKAMERLGRHLTGATILHGGRTDAAAKYIEPSLIEVSDTSNALMQEEIFGPLLPLIAFENFEEAKTIIAQNPNPLAFYVFTETAATEQRWLAAVPFGGGCVNNAAWHLTNPHLPFGGRGASGTGAYHGKASFDVFSHRKSVMKTPTWFDPAMKYPPFKGKLGLFKKLVR